MALLVGGVLGDALRPQIRSTINNTLVRRAYVAIGASGAATVTQATDAAGGTITCVKNTTGIYDVTFPKLDAVATSVPLIRVWVVLSTATTVAQAFCKAYSPTAGTAQFVTALNAAGTPVEPASGDILAIEIVAADTSG
jgi:hypothetical protein